MALNAKLYIPAEAAQFPAQFFQVYSLYFLSPHTCIIQYSAKDLKGTFIWEGGSPLCYSVLPGDPSSKPSQSELSSIISHVNKTNIFSLSK